MLPRREIAVRLVGKIAAGIPSTTPAPMARTHAEQRRPRPPVGVRERLAARAAAPRG